MNAQALDAEARGLAQALRDSQLQRCLQAQLWSMFRLHCPIRASRADQRRALYELVGQLVQAGILRTPTASSWDRSLQPPLPRSVEILRAPVAAAGRETWLPQLAFAAGIQHPATREALAKINAFLKAAPDLAPVPLNERSLEIFGDEKRLEALCESDSVVRESLRLSDLGTYPVPPPLVHESQPAAQGRPALVLENLHSYESFRRWNREVAGFSAVIYGAGNAFLRSLSGVPPLLAEANADVALYLGDIDRKGLQIVTEAGARCPAIVPHWALYRWLLQHGQRRSGTWSGGIELAAWPTDIIDAITELSRGQLRIPQESFGSRQLRMQEFRSLTLNA